MSDVQPLSIAIEGVIGSGKTSLAQAMAAALDAHALLEEAFDNPFLELFYADRQRWALACQLFFLDQRLQQYAQARDPQRPVVTDYTIDKELLYAQVTMQAEEFQLYERYFARLAVEAAFHPRVIIYLSSDPEILIERIRRRGRAAEGSIDLSYLRALHELYHSWFTSSGVQGRRVVVVDGDAAFIARDPSAVSLLIEACVQAPVGVSYCNPIA